MKIVWITTRPWLAVAAALLLSGVDSHKNGIGNLREAMPREHLGKPGYLGSLATHVVTVSELLQGTGSGSGKPFFAYLGFQANHVPVQAPQSFIDKYKGRYKDGWTALRQARRDRAVKLGLIPKGAPMVTMSTTVDWNSLSDKESSRSAFSATWPARDAWK